MRKSVLAALPFAFAFALAAQAQPAPGADAGTPAATGAVGDRQTGGDGDRQGGGPNGVTPAADVVRAFQDASARMQRGMEVAFTGEAGRDFAQAMIPHREGAIAMARVAMANTSDPEIRRLAGEAIATHEREIAQLKAWLARNAR
jgi:hypothetical protein